MQTAAGKLYLFVAIDRTSKFACVELHERATKMIAAEFLRQLNQAVPYQIHTILTDDGIQFKKREQDRTAMERGPDRFYAWPRAAFSFCARIVMYQREFALPRAAAVSRCRSITREPAG